MQDVTQSSIRTHVVSSTLNSASNARPQPAVSYQSGYTDSMNLMCMHAFLLQVVGRKGADTLWLYNQNQCGPHASSAALARGLFHLCVELLGESLAHRMLVPGWTLAYVHRQA